MPRLLARHLDHAHGDVGALLDVVGDHRTVVHLVDVIAGQHQHVLRPVRQNQLEVLVDGIGGAAVPVLADLLLRRHHLDELAELAAQIAPAALHVLDQRLRLVLRQDEIWRMPEFTQFDSTKSMMRNLPPKGVAGLQRCTVRSFSRSPRPPAMMTASVPLVRRLT